MTLDQQTEIYERRKAQRRQEGRSYGRRKDDVADRRVNPQPSQMDKILNEFNNAIRRL